VAIALVCKTFKQIVDSLMTLRIVTKPYNPWHSPNDYFRRCGRPYFYPEKSADHYLKAELCYDGIIETIHYSQNKPIELGWMVDGPGVDYDFSFEPPISYGDFLPVVRLLVPHPDGSTATIMYNHDPESENPPCFMLIKSISDFYGSLDTDHMAPALARAGWK
jgi:hypothetical protein